MIGVSGGRPSSGETVLMADAALAAPHACPLTAWLEGQDVPQASAAHSSPAQALYAEAMQGLPSRLRGPGLHLGARASG